ncbi:mycoredoxin Mrx1 [Gordonia sinesedis]
MSNVIDDDASARVSDSGELTMYTTPWCGYCARLKTGLRSLGVEWQEVDIELNPDAADFVGSVNGGNHTVPTILYADGTTATNPSIADVKAKLGL